MGFSQIRRRSGSTTLTNALGRVCARPKGAGGSGVFHRTRCYRQHAVVLSEGEKVGATNGDNEAQRVTSLITRLSRFYSLRNGGEKRGMLL